MNKTVLLLTLSCIQIYHRSTSAINLSSIWQKTEHENITKEYQVTRNCMINLYNTEGSITIKQWNQPKITIEVSKKGTAEQLKTTTLACKVVDTDVHITTRVATDARSAKVHYNLMIPEDASINITQTKGPIRVKGILGSIDVSLEEGPIDIVDSTKAVSAKTGSGDIKVKQKKFDEPNIIFLESHKGNIALYLPRETCAILHAKTVSGTITSDHPVTLTPLTIKLNKQGWERLRKEVDGTLGGIKGGAPITLETTRGNIAIREY